MFFEVRRHVIELTGGLLVTRDRLALPLDGVLEHRLRPGATVVLRHASMVILGPARRQGATARQIVR